MESEQPHLDTTSFLSRQSSGIRAIPSHDDDDDDDGYDSEHLFETTNSPEKNIENVEVTKNSPSVNVSSDDSSFISDSNGSFISGEDEFDTYLTDSDEETVEKPVPAVGLVSNSQEIVPRKVSVPIAKVSVDEDDNENEDDEVDLEDGVGDRVYGVGNAPRVRVLVEEDVGENEDEDDGSKEESKKEDNTNVVGENEGEGSQEEEYNSETAKQLSDEEKIDKSVVVTQNGAPAGGFSSSLRDDDSKGVDGEPVNGSEAEDVMGEKKEGGIDGGMSTSVEFTKEEDLVVDSIKVDEVEIVRSGTAVVGEKNDEGSQEESKVVSFEKEVEIDGGVSTGAGFTNERDAVVDSIKVDEVEAARSGVAVVGVEGGDVEERKQDEVNSRNEEICVGEVSDPVAVEDIGVKPTKEETFVGETAVSYKEVVVRDAKEEKENEAGVADKEDSIEASTEIGVVEPEDAVDLELKEGKEHKVKSGNGEISVGEEPSVGVERNGVMPTIEQKSVVDTAPVKVGEAVSYKGVVVGDNKEEKGFGKTGMETESSIAEHPNQVGENSVHEESVLVDTKASETDVSEAISYKAVVVGENKEGKELGKTGIQTENSVPVDTKASETDVVKSTAGEEDSVVDVIHVDAVEAVRSGVAVVGDLEGEGMEKHVEEVKATVGESVTLGNDFEPLIDDKPESIPDSDVESHREKDSVVDGIHVDVVEAAMPGIAVVGDSEGEELQKQVEEVKAPLVETESVALGNDFEPLMDSITETVNNNDVEYAENKMQMEDIKRETENIFVSGLDEFDTGDSDADGEPNGMFSASATDSNRLLEEFRNTLDPSKNFDGQVLTESDEEEADTDEEVEGEEKQILDSAALAALLKAATGGGDGGSDPGTFTITSQDGSRLFSVERPAGLGSAFRPVRPTSRLTNSSLSNPSVIAAQSGESLSEEEKKKLQLIHQLRVKFLRLVKRLGHTADDSIASQVLYRMALLAGRPTSPLYSLEIAKQTATKLEDEGKDDLDFSVNILVLGKTGVGKSATVNSIFGEELVKINAFEPETTSVNVINGILDGVKIRVMDAPGLKTSGMEQGFNRKVLASVKKFMKKFPPDVTLYVDRMDSQTRDLNDLPMLRTITSSLGSSVWRSVIVTLTHASCAPPEGPSGSSLKYEVFVAQRSHMVQQSIGQAVGDLRLMNPTLMNPVSLVENHPSCRKNQDGRKVLPNGEAWRPQLLLLSYSLKILSEANSVLKTKDSSDPRKLFGFRARAAPLPYLLSTMLQPRAHPKLSADQGGDNGDSDIDLDDLSDSDQEEEDEYDQLPPFKPLRKAQIAKLSSNQRKAYFDEYDYRVKLLQRKQWREELKRMREMKKGKKSGVDDIGMMPEDYEGEDGAPAAVPVPLPDMVLPPSFDSDNPAYRYRFLEPTSQFVARPVLDTHGWDHDCGYDGVNLEQNVGIVGRFPAQVAAQVTKDKKEFNVHLDSAVSAKHGENGLSLVGFDVQTLGKQTAYIVRAETKFRNLKKNKTGAGVSVTFLAENVATGVKLEDQISVGKRLVLLGSTGTVRSQKDAAYGANLEVQLRDADHPIGQDQSSLNLSLMKWRGDLAVGGNLQSQISVGRTSKVGVRVSLNNKLSGQISVKTSSSDSLQIALAGLVPIVLSIYQNFRPSVNENYSLY